MLRNKGLKKRWALGGNEQMEAGALEPAGSADTATELPETRSPPALVPLAGAGGSVGRAAL